jgi:CDGSH-type Zn-finger protein
MTDTEQRVKEYKVVIVPNGPYLVKGGVPINMLRVTFDKDDMPVGYELVKEYPVKEVQSLCRCGKSKVMPFCDGSHAIRGFHSGPDYKLEPFESSARRLVGRNLILLDYRELCMGVGFCHRAGSTWVLTRFSDNLEKRRLAIEEAGLCPSGRLVAVDKQSGEDIEPELKPGISIIDDPRFKTLFPFWLKGKVQIESQDGTVYEPRARVTLCSCGKSHIKPFCDGNHYYA